MSECPPGEHRPHVIVSATQPGKAENAGVVCLGITTAHSENCICQWEGYSCPEVEWFRTNSSQVLKVRDLGYGIAFELYDSRLSTPS